MKKTVCCLFVLTLCAVSFLVGDKLGYKEGFHHGYGLECKADLEKLKSVVENQRKALENINNSVQAYVKMRDSIKVAEQKKAKYNQENSTLLEKTYNGAIIGFDEAGMPILDEDRLKELAGLK